MAKAGQRFLIVYSFVLTAVFAVTVFGAAAPQKTRFGEIDVQRINVVEPDGTLRMTISNHARFPGLIVHGKEKPFERPQAGMLFFNDEASEIGGLIFGGRRNAKGEIVDSGGALSFDRFEGNQIVQMIGVDDKEDRIVGLIVSDNPAEGDGHRRIWVGTGEEGASTVALMDAKGRKRILLQVAADGSPSLAFLDAEGKILQRMAPAKPE
jgi:hypothetical protein